MNNVTNHTTTAAVPDERLRIVIVEDNRAIASALRIVLQHEGYDTRWCEDESVYNVIHDWKPSLILMDLKMPRLDGYYATNAIKTDPETKGIPVIVVTAENISRERLAEIHANDLLTKPFPVPRLLERVAFWINHPNDLPAVHGLSGPSAGGTPTGASGTGGTSGGAHTTSGAGRHAHGGFGQPGFAGSRA